MRKYVLPEAEIPKRWLNIIPLLPEPLEPPLDPETKEPMSPEKLSVIFPEPLIEQEVSDKEWIEIPDEVMDIYALWRPSPLHRAKSLEEFLGTPAKIFYKNESVSPPGSHKPNTAVAQAYYNKISGVKRLTTETGAGQWGSALSFATQFFGIECRVYMVRVSYNQKPYRRILMETWKGEVIPSPSPYTNAGRQFNEKDPEHPGSLGIAISEAIEEAATREDTKYSLGSVLNHVLLHQTVIGLETKRQMEEAGVYPDIVIGAVGGGSNFAGLSFPFIADRLRGDRENLRVIAVEPEACPTLTKGEYRYDFGDTVGLTPLIKMHTLGHDFVPPPIHAGGLRYHGDAPLVCKLYDLGYIEAVAYKQTEVFEAALTFARTEGIVPAPESSHAIKAAIDEALKCKETGEEKVILFNLSGHGYFDLSAYDKYLRGELEDG
ncbi:TrpB-like pyridoxal phosphate-dependent enzyme [Hydrogenivirga sp. 128-5-R1-1]|uniref:TrpB-like pyridoxal phosphate-dependent enzyme n=1 Tax=Hydrogenivirga sp. 128-5-R1-1 TaxID=392423 RepID=UPI00015F3998|nr:TrpB-like pyridoxal phosphate-dependent enzyme [Hydrogenivirga sp. 128-5-R1-1]EDP75066.1 tryptophan synthase subunit beta [Hydrogenivirga sp. 128-5-R1-1]